MRGSPGAALRDAMAARPMTCFIGAYDVFSATMAGRHFDGIFISGFGFAASYYGLPDIGFIAWPDIVNFVQRVRTVLPHHHIMVDIDDGYVDIETAIHVVSLLEKAGASGVIMEDQRRPRRCGHMGGKQILDLEEYLPKLERVLQVRKEMVVVARSDATDPAERIRRARAFDQAGADAVLVDGLENLDMLRQISSAISKPLMFNQIAGGKSPACTLSDLRRAGVSLVNYSTPCLFAAQQAMESALSELKKLDGLLVNPAAEPGRIGIAACDAVLRENLKRRDEPAPTSHPLIATITAASSRAPATAPAMAPTTAARSAPLPPIDTMLQSSTDIGFDQSNSSPRNVLPKYAART